PLTLKGAEQDRAQGAGTAFILDGLSQGQQGRLVQDVDLKGRVLAAEAGEDRRLGPSAVAGAGPGLGHRRGPPAERCGRGRPYRCSQFRSPATGMPVRRDTSLMDSTAGPASPSSPSGPKLVKVVTSL